MGSPSQGTEIYTCELIFECARRCTTETCQQECANRASSSAQSHLDELNRCDSTYRCSSDMSCLSDNCPTQLENCGFTPMPSTPNSNESRDMITTCLELRVCEDNCRNSSDQDTCVEECYRLVTNTQAISDLNRLESCALNSNCSNQECLIQSCRNELTACGYEVEDSGSNRNDPPETTPNPQTGLSCTEVWNCLTECMDNTCAQYCYEAGSDLSSNQAANLVACYNYNYDYITDINDLYTYCPAEASTCFDQ